MKITQVYELNSSLQIMNFLKEQIEAGTGTVVGLYQPPTPRKELPESDIVRSVTPEEVIASHSLNGMQMYWFTYDDRSEDVSYTHVTYQGRDAWVKRIERFSDLRDAMPGNNAPNALSVEEVTAPLRAHIQYNTYDEYQNVLRTVYGGLDFMYSSLDPACLNDPDFLLVSSRAPDAYIDLRWEGLVPLSRVIDSPVAACDPDPTKLIVMLVTHNAARPHAFVCATMTQIIPLNEYGEDVSIDDIEEDDEIVDSFIVSIQYWDRESKHQFIRSRDLTIIEELRPNMSYGE